MKAFAFFQNKLAVSIFSAVMGFSFLAQSAVWDVTQQWSPEMEKQYQTWIKTFAQVDMFSKEFLADGITPNPYYGIITDCADTVYIMRMIFSRENGLPWAMKNPSNPRKLITQATTKYDKIKDPDARFKRFFTDIADIVSTKTLDEDTYPVSVNKITPGTIILTTKKNHHSWTIADILPDGNPRLIFNSSAGRESGSLVQQRFSWPNPFWVYEAEEIKLDPENPESDVKRIPVFVPDSYAGLRYWIPIDKLLDDPKNLTDYSNDQFDMELKSWKHTLQLKLATKKETISDVVSRLLTDACSDIQQRISAVQEAETYKTKLKAVVDIINAGSEVTDEDQQSILNQITRAKDQPENKMCLIYDRYDQYSTPSRDRRLFDGIMLARAYFRYGLLSKGAAAFSPTRLAQFKKIFSQPNKSAKEETAIENTPKVGDKFSICSVDIGNGKKIDLAEIKRRLFKGYISPNPNEDLTGRWGGRGSRQSNLAAQCSTYGDSYAPYDLDASEAQAQLEIEEYRKSN